VVSVAIILKIGFIYRKFTIGKIFYELIPLAFYAAKKYAGLNMEERLSVFQS
jgi:hypothetical protein